MADQDRLGSWIGSAIGAGIPKPVLRAELIAEGWTDREADAALAAWSDTPGAAGAIPRPVRSTAARDALFYALLFITFGMVSGQVLALLFGQIDLWLADPTTRYIGGAGTARWSLAALIVFAPTFWLLDRADRRSLVEDPARRHGTVRRWLSSIAILIAAMVLLSDALYVIFSYLDGALSSRFIAKALTVAGMAVLVLGYFRQDRGRTPATAALLGLAALTAVLTFTATGGPAKGRMQARDRAHLSDLDTLSYSVRTCLADRADLPETFDPTDCAPSGGTLSAMAEDVRYERLSDTEFRLCVEIEDPGSPRLGNTVMDGTEACRVQSLD
ncbi:hypothetical protein GCM10011415_19150 [Salipiger pallidus]|uniref:DUF5671 domain-containing protein n=1 Tax=Salipiger pallidus TaxID=1775170 RepID=A0A8J2ZJE8_9RHOB|nr:DUF5671 domain-containing protein [Salipiger pallidus]GGG71467.1 hypothetical protein GCM10011415_19150 [Salipiger pallidus]